MLLLSRWPLRRRAASLSGSEQSRGIVACADRRRSSQLSAPRRVRRV